MRSQERNTNNMANRGDHVVSDINALTYSWDTLVSGNFGMSPRCCIFKIPSILSRHNEKLYAPNAFSIGPWHLGKSHLEATQKCKKKYLQGLIFRLSSNPDQLRQLEDDIRMVADDARECYAGPVEFTTEDLVKILVLDGCFIIELFRKYSKVVPIDEDDPIFTISCMFPFLYHDLILLENQIPWFVLEHLFDMTKTPAEESTSLDQLALFFFGNMFSSERPSMDKLWQMDFRSHDSKHILDLLRNWLIFPFGKENCRQNFVPGEGRSNIWWPFPSATSLRHNGILLRKAKSIGILDVRFTSGILEIPALLIHETTKTIFRNLISLEQCIRDCPPIISSYAILMDDLVATTEDMEMLCRKGIINSRPSSDDSSQFFNGLCIDADIKNFHYHQLCQEVNQFCSQPFQKWRAVLVQNYFKDPMSIVNFTSGVVVIVTLTFIQTICSILQLRSNSP